MTDAEQLFEAAERGDHAEVQRLLDWVRRPNWNQTGWRAMLPERMWRHIYEDEWGVSWLVKRRAPDTRNDAEKPSRTTTKQQFALPEPYWRSPAARRRR